MTRLLFESSSVTSAAFEAAPDLGSHYCMNLLTLISYSLRCN